MGRQRFHTVGCGMTQQEAFNNAVENANEEHGHQEGYSGAINSYDGSGLEVKCLVKPVKASKCQVEDLKPHNLKWTTYYWVSTRFDDRYVGKTLKKADALKMAKDYALAHNEVVVIELKKVADKNTEVARISPKKSVQGKWSFAGDARC